ncbi:hypothetical protein [Bradyrhizobium sp. B120]|uniref:hypothetical protein n=1 Tax=Bradyrhizobium sp. B120 TaxID=3410088 RepID=UPI003B97DBCB
MAAEARLIFAVVLELAADVVVGLVEKPDKLVDFVPCFFAEAPYGHEQIFRGNVGLEVERASGRRSARHRCAIVEST